MLTNNNTHSPSADKGMRNLKHAEIYPRYLGVACLGVSTVVRTPIIYLIRK